MKNKTIFSIIIMLGIFLVLDTPLLAQSSSSKSSKSSEAEKEVAEAEAASRARSRSAGRAYDRARSVYVTAPEMEIDMGDYAYAYSYGSSDVSSKLTLSKSYSGQSADKQGTFEVEDGVRKIRLSLHGKVNVGSIQISIILPDGKVLTTVNIDDSADVSWSKSINVKEEETKYYGEWKYAIKADKVEGKYNMSINTY